ncbi:MAG: UvrB/UvrC motif-containing protein [Elusimicrobiota bacterium]
MICDKCKKKEATVFINKIENGQQIKLNLCGECAAESSLSPGAMFPSFQNNFFDSISDMLAGFSDEYKEDSGKEISCEKCGNTFRDFQVKGRMGCENCYVVFEDKLLPFLKRLQGSIQHAGKSPPMQSKKDELRKLKKDLSEAVAKEEYERAAVIRDKIKDIKGGSDEAS